MSDSSTKVCVTGASGFIASQLVADLLAKGYQVVGTVRDKENADKVGHLLSLPGADDALTLVNADLLVEGSFDEAVRGCACVFHTASPFFFHTENPEVDLLDPAVKGTRNVLNSCKKEKSIGKVVVTSSCAAVWVGLTQDGPWTEDHWSDEHSMRENKKWYPLSKTLAERAAWEFASEEGVTFKLIAINPTMVIGPQLQPTLNTSTAFLLPWVNGEKMEGYPPGSKAWVDVRDVSTAHILAFEKPEANGRYVCVGDSVSWKDACERLHDLFPDMPVPTTPRALKDGERLVEQTNIPCTKLRSLGLETFKSFKESAKDTIESAKVNGFLKK